MYSNVRSRVRLVVLETVSDNVLVQEQLHRASVLSPLLFIILLETISREIRLGCLEELLDADDTVLASETLEDLKGRLEVW